MVKGLLCGGRFTIACAMLAAAATVWAGPVYQPPGANLTYGDVAHGQRVLSTSTNPAAAAANLERSDGSSGGAAALTASAGLEYGNLDNLFAFYDGVTGGYDPGEPGAGGGPGQLPEDKPSGGIDLGEIWDSLDPDARAAAEAVAAEVARQAALLAIIRDEGFAKAWVSADIPVLLKQSPGGGAWTLGLNWSGSTKARGVVDAIDFDAGAAQEILAAWLNELPVDRTSPLALSDEVLLYYDAASNRSRLGLDNDSSIISKSSQTTEFSAAYSRLAWSNESGGLYLGSKARLYLAKLSRISVRFGDITDSEELFDAIRDSDFSNDTRLGFDAGVLWVADNYQLGAQITNLNSPKFSFPELDLQPYRNPDIIEFLRRDRVYRMNAQLKFEASVFSASRRWSAHLGLDADSATDPLGDDYRWLTLSAGWVTTSRWLPNVRLGYRENLEGSRAKYLSAGLTFFNIMNFDVAASLETASINGRDLPRGLMASLGFQINW